MIESSFPFSVDCGPRRTQSVCYTHRPMSNPVSARAMAWSLRALDAYLHRVLGSRKQALLARAPGRLVELGAGSGANFRYLPRGTRVTAIEPNRTVHGSLRRAAVRRDIELTVHAGFAEQLELGDSSEDAVLCSLVLCSVRRPEQALQEVLRVLKPGGRLLFLEHVAARAGTRLRRLQAQLEPFWLRAFDGCHLQRETWKYLEEAGFSSLELEYYQADTLALPIRPQIIGTAVK